MNTRILVSVALLACLQVLISCSTSVLYDPTLRMPTRQLQTSGVQGTVGWGMLPEVLPNAVNGRRSDHALLLDARGGLSKRVTIQARGWLGMPAEEGNKRWGIGGSILYAIDTGSIGWRQSMLLSGAFGINEKTIQGQGGALNYILYTPEWLGLQPYFSAGGIIAMSSSDFSEWGMAPLLHAGASWQFTPNAGLNAEVTTTFQFNFAEDVYHTIITPSLSVYVQL